MPPTDDKRGAGGYRLMPGRTRAARTEAAYVLLRVVAGLLFAFHGVQKLFGLFTDFPTPVATQLWFGGIIELAAGTAIAAGLFTTLAAFLASGTMAVAYVQFHWQLELGARFFPAVNRGELALLYAVLFLYMACRGDGATPCERSSPPGRARSRKRDGGAPHSRRKEFVKWLWSL